MSQRNYHFCVVGGGWRAEFFLRAAKFLPELFTADAVFLRSPDKYPGIQKFGVKIVSALEEIYTFKPDFVVLAVGRDAMPDMIDQVTQAGFAVLAETPPAADPQAMAALWQRLSGRRSMVQIAEQYFLQPLYAAWLNFVRQGFIGEVQNIDLRAVHDYHALSLIRLFLGVGMQAFSVSAEQFPVRTVETDSRDGYLYTGLIKESLRRRGRIRFAEGKYAFYDFNGLQYHTTLYTRHIDIQGTRGEISDLSVAYLLDDLSTARANLERIDRGLYNNINWSLQAIRLGEKLLYTSPFPEGRMNDDEIAVASLMLKMGEMVDGGPEPYPLAEAMQDSYVAYLLQESAKRGGEIIESEVMPWQK